MKFFGFDKKKRSRVTSGMLVLSMLIPASLEGVIIVKSGKEMPVERKEIKIRRVYDMKDFEQATGVTKAMIPERLDLSHIETYELDRIPVQVFKRLSEEQLAAIFETLGLLETLNNLGPERLKAISHYGSKLFPTPQEIGFLAPEAFSILDPYRTLSTARLTQQQFYELFHYAPHPDYAHEFKAHDIINRRGDLIPEKIAQTIAVNVIGRGVDHISMLPLETQARLLLISKELPRQDWLATSTDELSLSADVTGSEPSQLETEVDEKVEEGKGVEKQLDDKRQ